MTPVVARDETSGIEVYGFIAQGPISRRNALLGYTAGWVVLAESVVNGPLYHVCGLH
jgi:hypothetical protein